MQDETNIKFWNLMRLILEVRRYFTDLQCCYICVVLLQIFLTEWRTDNHRPILMVQCKTAVSQCVNNRDTAGLQLIIYINLRTPHYNIRRYITQKCNRIGNWRITNDDLLSIRAMTEYKHSTKVLRNSDGLILEKALPVICLMFANISMAQCKTAVTPVR